MYADIFCRLRVAVRRKRPEIREPTVGFLGDAVARLNHCATNRKVAGSIPDGVIGIFQ